MNRFAYLGQEDPDEETPRVEKIKKKPSKSFDDGTTKKRDTKRRKPKRKK